MHKAEKLEFVKKFNATLKDKDCVIISHYKELERIRNF